MHCARATLASLCLGAAFGLSALATPTLYTTSGGFTPAVAGLTPGSLVDFNGITTDQHYTGSPWLTLGGVEFRADAPTPDLLVRHLTGSTQFKIPPAPGTLSSSVLFGPRGDWIYDPSAVWQTGYLQVLLPEGVRAVTGYVSSADPSGIGAVSTVNFRVNTSDVPGSVPTVTGGYLSFFGVTSETDISALWIYTDRLHVPVLDNFQFYTATAETPEADTWILACSGLVLLLVGARAHQRMKPRLCRARLPWR